MDDHELTWYMQEIAMHGLGADLHFSALKDALDNPDLRQTRIVWFHLTSFLAHAAMISKYLSPVRPQGTKQQRMEVLRERLNVTEDSEVLPRDSRDNIEHFDERIDNWVGSANQNILEVVLDGREGYEYIRGEEKRIKRVLLMNEFIFISEKRDGSKLELSLRPVAEEIHRISEEAQRWLDGESPYHFIYPQQFT
jgi:hypothetical protein